MKRRQLNKTDRNTHYASSNNASKPQDVLGGQIWINTEARENGVKITELNSSYSSSDENEGDRLAHSWSYIKRAANADDQYNRNRENKISNTEQGESSKKYDDITDYFFTNESNANMKKDLEKLIIRHEFRCLKMLQNHLVFGSDSSDDDYEEMLRLEDEYNERRSYEERQSDETPKDVWGYVRNKDVLVENDFTFTDIPGKDTKELLSYENTELMRLPTPPGNNCIQKIKFSLPMLPTVTEVTEPNKPVDEDIETNMFKGNVPITPKSVNSWVGSDERNKSKNLITWRKISPKEPNLNKDSVSEINNLSALGEENKNGRTICIDSGNYEVASQNEYEVEEKSDEESDVEVITDTNQTFESHKNNSPTVHDKLNVTFSYDSTDSNMFHANSKDNSQRKSGENVAELGETTLLRYLTFDKSTQTGDLAYIAVPPLHLSLLNSEQNQSTWYTRILQCFCCCKSRQ